MAKFSSKMESVEKQFPFVTEFLRQYEDLQVPKIERLDEQTLNLKPTREIDRSSGTYNWTAIYFFDKDGRCLKQVRGETVWDALNGPPFGPLKNSVDDVENIVLIVCNVWSTKTMTIYKLPSGHTLTSWIRLLRQQADAELKAQLAHVNDPYMPPRPSSSPRRS